jgi:predicted nucleic acid-binding Zn ribbon protein
MAAANRRVRRTALLVGFYGVLVILLLTVVSSYVELDNK